LAARDLWHAGATWDGAFAVKNMAQISGWTGAIMATISCNSRVYIQAIESQKSGRFCCTNSSVFQVFVCVSAFLDVRVIFLGSGEERTAPAGGALGLGSNTGGLNLRSVALKKILSFMIIK
jgi:hypothetical protein